MFTRIIRLEIADCGVVAWRRTLKLTRLWARVSRHYKARAVLVQTAPNSRRCSRVLRCLWGLTCGCPYSNFFFSLLADVQEKAYLLVYVAMLSFYCYPNIQAASRDLASVFSQWLYWSIWEHMQSATYCVPYCLPGTRHIHRCQFAMAMLCGIGEFGPMHPKDVSALPEFDCCWVSLFRWRKVQIEAENGSR